MNKTIKKKWIAALESDKYKQGSHCLRSREDKFCCLGVLCDIIDKDAWKKRANHSYIWKDISKVVALSTRKAIHLNELDQEALVILNDESNKSLKEIAKWIKKNIKEDK